MELGGLDTSGMVSPGLMAAGMVYMNLSIILRLCNLVDLMTGQLMRGIGALLCLLSITLPLPWVGESGMLVESNERLRCAAGEREIRLR